MAKAKKKTGSARMIENGKKPVLIWLTPDEHGMIRDAAFREGRALANYVKYHSLRIACEAYEQMLDD